MTESAVPPLVTGYFPVAAESGIRYTLNKSSPRRRSGSSLRSFNAAALCSACAGMTNLDLFRNALVMSSLSRAPTRRFGLDSVVRIHDFFPSPGAPPETVGTLLLSLSLPGWSSATSTQ